jgi:hypothetical protein
MNLRPFSIYTESTLFFTMLSRCATCHCIQAKSHVTRSQALQRHCAREGMTCREFSSRPLTGAGLEVSCDKELEGVMDYPPSVQRGTNQIAFWDPSNDSRFCCLVPNIPA